MSSNSKCLNCGHVHLEYNICGNDTGGLTLCHCKNFNPKPSMICVCGHPENYHYESNCNWCNCKGFNLETGVPEMPIDPKPNLSSFFVEVERLLESTAKDKGYSANGPKNNPLMNFMDEFFPDHALGEIVYKSVRFKSKKNPEDLAKIAAWAALLWLQEQR